MPLSKTQISIGVGIAIIALLIFFIPSKRESPSSSSLESASSTTAATSTGGSLTTSTNTSTSSPRKQTQNATIPTNVSSSKTPPSSKTMTARLAPEFKDPTGFTNTEPFLMKDVLGKKIILVNFLTSSSIASMRTLPYLHEWHAKYKDKGLLVLMIHTPRFEFERYKDNVDNLAHDNDILYPIVSDNKYGTWNSYGNKDWPHQYLIDIDGRIIYDHSGEGVYETLEAKIQETLALRAKSLGLKTYTYSPFNVPKGAITVDFSSIKSPETYFGYARNGTIGNAVTGKEGQQDLEFKDTSKKNTPYLSGSWYFTKEYAKNMIENAHLRYTFSAKRVYMVLGSLRMNKVKVLMDGAPLGDAAGRDIRVENGQSYLYVTDERIYEILDNPKGYEEHTIELVFETAGLQVYTITFG